MAFFDNTPIHPRCIHPVPKRMRRIQSANRLHSAFIRGAMARTNALAWRKASLSHKQVPPQPAKPEPGSPSRLQNHFSRELLRQRVLRSQFRNTIHRRPDWPNMKGRANAKVSLA
jgi:hypothetical protein